MLPLNITLWYGSWRWINKAKTIKAPSGKDTYIQSIAFKARNQTLSPENEFLTRIVAPKLRQAKYEDFASNILDLTVATGPPLKDKPNNNVIATGLDDFQTLKGFVTNSLRYDMPSDARQLHLTLATEEEAGTEEVELLPNSPPQVHKQPRMDIGPLSYDDKKKSKAKPKIRKRI